jgi:hypothetical protein
MEITKVKGGRIAKYRYRESMNEKAPEVAERNSKRNCLGMCRSSEKLSRRPGSEMMWPSGGGCRTCNHKGSNPGTVAAALEPTMARSGEARTAGVRRACTRKEICRLPAGVQARRVPGRVLAGPKNSIRPTGGPRVVRQYPISSTPACDSTLSSKIFVVAMLMDVSSIQTQLRMRVATEKVKTVPYRFTGARALAGARSRVVEAQSEKGLIPEKMATPWLTDA